MGRTASAWIMKRTADEWRGLTGGQRSAWWDFAMDHPVTYWNGAVKMLNAWQMFNYCNVMLAIAAYSFMVWDPPTNLDLPEKIDIPVTLWKVKAKVASGDSTYHGRALVNLDTPLPDNRVIIFYQFWEKWQLPYFIPPIGTAIRTRNAAKRRAGVLYPGFSGQYDLASDGGMNISQRWRSDNIQGNWSRSHPDKPIGHYRVVSTVNGMYQQFPLLITP